MSFAPGDYEFAVTADDGVRLFVDGVLVIDKWIDQGADDLPRDAAAGRRSAHRRHGVLRERRRGDGPPRATAGSATCRPRRPTTRSTGTLPDGRRARRRIPSGPGRTSSATTRRSTSTGATARPGAGIAADRFVARWTKTVVALGGPLPVQRRPRRRHARLHRRRAGGRRVDRRATTTYSVDKVVAGGTHELRVEYFEARRRRAGGVLLRADRRRRRPADGGYAGRVLRQPQPGRARPSLTRPDDARRLQLGRRRARRRRARRQLLGPVDEVAGRGRGRLVQVHRDRRRRRPPVHRRRQGARQVDPAGRATTYTVIRHLTPGTHEVVLEYFEAGGGAVAKLDYEPTADPPPPPPPTRSRPSTSTTATLSGTPVLTRTDDAIDFDWGSGSPGSGRPVRPLLGALDKDQGLRGGHLSVQRHR